MNSYQHPPSAELIRQCVGSLPPNSYYFRPFQSQRELTFGERYSIALHDPKFGWNIVNAICLDRLPLETVRMTSWMLKGYGFLTSNHEPEVDSAHALTHPQNKSQSNLLKALLLCRGISTEAIAQFLQIPEKVVAAFDHLFFNVRTRLNEHLYITRILYPNGLMETQDPDYLRKVDPGLLLMRAGYKYGSREVARLAGIYFHDDITTTSCMEDLEYEIASQAALAVRHGQVHDSSSSAVKNGLRLLGMRKEKEKTNLDPDQIMGLGAISAKHSILETMAQMQENDLLIRLRTLKELDQKNAARRS